MITTGVEGVLISVSDMDESLAFYRDWVGMEVVADQRLEPDKIQRFWNLSKETEAEVVILKNEEQSTLLELIGFKPRSGIAIREGAQPWDYGIYDIAFLVRDLDKTYNDLIKKGFTLCSPPIAYSPDWVPFDVKFETDDLSELIEKFKQKKVRIIFGPAEMEIDPHGRIKAIAVEGPSEVMIEFFEK